VPIFRYFSCPISNPPDRPCGAAPLEDVAGTGQARCSVWQYRHLVIGAVAIFVYVGVIAGYVADMSTIVFSFIVSVVCYLYIVYYGLKGSATAAR
jgi:fucose permease